jgi:hypothetical protein
VQQYIVGIYEQPADALGAFDRMDAQRPPDEKQSAIWRSFIEARSAHSPTLTAKAIRRIGEAADQSKITRENEVMMLAGLGEPGRAIEAANSARDHQRLETWILFAPVTRNLRQDPGFSALAARLGLIKYWRETGKHPDFCTGPAPRNECSPQLLAAIKSN